MCIYLALIAYAYKICFKCRKKKSLVIRDRIILHRLHIKLWIMKQFVKAIATKTVQFLLHNPKIYSELISENFQAGFSMVPKYDALLIIYDWN